MSPQRLIRFMRTPFGGLLVYVVLFMTLVFSVGIIKSKDSEPRSVEPNRIDLSHPPTHTRVQRAPAPFNPPPPQPQPPPSIENQRVETKLDDPSIRVYEQLDPQPEPPRVTGFAPYGRLIPCELTFTVDSSNIHTPIIGLVTEDIWHGGELIIPTGSEIHGRAQSGRFRDRIQTQDNWVIVFSDGRVLRFTGNGLTQDVDPDGHGWEVTDGSAGLRGQLITTTNPQEIKLLVATFLSGMSDLNQQTRGSVFGNQIVSNARNAALNGGGAVIDLYAQRILETIQRDATFVRVPSGSTFYVYLTQTLNLSSATVGTGSVRNNIHP